MTGRIYPTLALYIHMVRRQSAGLGRSSLTSMQLLVEVIAVGLILANALHEPYRTRTQVVRRLQRHGLGLYMVRHQSLSKTLNVDLKHDCTDIHRYVVVDKEHQSC